MKRRRPYLKYLFTLVCSILSYTARGQCWELVYEAPGGDDIVDVFHFNDSLVWICGRDNLLAFSSDNGSTWQDGLSPFDFNTYNYAVWFHNPQEGVIGSSEDLFYTLDGGENWEEALVYYPDGTLADINIIPRDIYFKNEEEGWVVNRGDDAILHTINGGLSWQVQEETSLYGFFNFVYTSGDTLYVRAIRNALTHVYYTTTGGEDWDVKEVSIDQSRGGFYNNTVSWWGSPGNKIYKSEDFLETFDSVMVDTFDAEYHSTRYLKFANENLGWAPVSIIWEYWPNYSETGGMYVSTDGGTNWKRQNPEILAPIWLEIINDSLAFSMTDYGELYRYRGRPSTCGPIPVTLEESSLYPMYTWPEAEGCFDGYYLQLGTLPEEDDILAQIDVGLDTFYQLMEALPEETEVYATVLPYNHVYGTSSACESSSFTTITCPPSPIVVDTGYCKGGSLLWGDSLINVPGQYTFPGVRENGCDSTVLVNVIQYEDPVTPIDTFYCQGDTFYWQDSLLSGTGTYKFTYLAASGCDSTVIITLEEIPLAYAQMDTLICEGEQYEGQDTILSEAGVYYFTYAGASGCDSTLQLNLEISPTYVLQLDTFFCEGESFPWGDSLLTEAGQYEFIYQTTAGCDSSWHINLEVYQNVYTQLDTTLQSGVPYDGVYYPNDTLLTFIYPGANGCDSIVQVQLDILNSSSSPISSPSYKLYPNPAKEVLYLESSEPINDIIMWNALGQSVHVRQESGQIGIKQLPTGLYFMRFKIGEQWYLERVVLE